MPYSTPSQGRPGHRRSYSHIAAPPAYASTTPALPRRRPHDDTPRKPTFQLGHDDDDDSSADEAMAKDDDGRALPPLRLKLKPSPFDAVPFLDKLAELGSPHGVDERDPADPLSR